jgi:hypothetical protein
MIHTHKEMSIESYAKELAAMIVNQSNNDQKIKDLAHVITFYGYDDAEVAYQRLCANA